MGDFQEWTLSNFDAWMHCGDDRWAYPPHLFDNGHITHTYVCRNALLHLSETNEKKPSSFSNWYGCGREPQKYFPFSDSIVPKRTLQFFNPAFASAYSKWSIAGFRDCLGKYFIAISQIASRYFENFPCIRSSAIYLEKKKFNMAFVEIWYSIPLTKDRTSFCQRYI